jgi:hypothetical protein
MGYREAGVKDLASRMRAHPDELLLNILPRKVQLRAGAGHSFSGLNGEFIDQHTTRETDDE